MADSLDTKISNILVQSIGEAQIIGNFQYGHNLLQSAVQIDEIFSMLDTIIKKVTSVIGDVIPDINLAPYKDGLIDSTRANLCWIELKENYYGLILNTQKGIQYRTFDTEDLQNLLLNGQTASWYLISKIQNLSYLISVDNGDNKTLTVEYFKNLIIDIIERFFYEHEHDKAYHPAGAVTLKRLNTVFASMQIQNTSSISPAGDIESHTGDATWSQSLIKTLKNEICWQSAPDVLMTYIDSSSADKILSSKYLNERSDVAVFLKETFDKLKKPSNSLNEYCFYSKVKFSVPYVNLNYLIESQLRGYVEILFKDDTRKRFYPDTSPIIVEKGKNGVTFVTVIKIDKSITNRIDGLVWPKGTARYLPNMRLVCSFTGISKILDEENG